MTGGRLVDPGTPDARLVVGFRPDPQHWPADLLAAEAMAPRKDLMNPGTDWIEQGRRLLETLRSTSADARPRRGRARARTAAGAPCARPPPSCAVSGRR